MINPDLISRFRTDLIQQIAATQNVPQGHPLGTKPYLALMLMLCTGQRRSDAVRMGWEDTTDGLIRVRQQKTNTPLVIPVVPTLQAALVALPKDAPTFLCTEYGRPYTAAGFGNWMRDRCNEAGLPNCSSHGLRKACARRLAEAGWTHHEIKAITGHKTDAEVRRYTEKSDQVLLARRALGKLQETDNQTKSANRLLNVSKHED
jgi:integrase